MKTTMVQRGQERPTGFWWRIGGGLLISSVLAAGVIAVPQAQDKKSDIVAQLGGTLGVVDYNNLIKAHPDYERLQQFDQQLGDLKAEIDAIPLLEKNDQRRKIEEKLKAEFMKAQQEMEAEKAAISAEMNGMEASIRAKLQGMADEGKARMEAKLKDYISKHAPEMANEPSAAPAPVQMPSQGDAARNLMLLRQRKNEAIKLEVEKAHREEIEAERARIDSEIAAYEDSVMKSHQQEKLNLQLKVQVAKDETEQADLQAQLEAISDEEEKLKDAKRAELEGSYKSFRADSEARQASEIKTQQARVDAEVKSQLGMIPDSAPAPAQPQQRPSGPKMTPELKALIAKEEARLTAEMQAASEEAKAKMEAEQASAMARLKAKSEELTQRIDKVKAEMKKAMEVASKESLSPATQAKIEMKQAQYDKLQKQRTELYDRMVADLKGDIGAVAQKNKIDIVIGSYVYRDEKRDDVPDLTDYAMVAIKTKARPDSP